MHSETDREEPDIELFPRLDRADAERRCSRPDQPHEQEIVKGQPDDEDRQGGRGPAPDDPRAGGHQRGQEEQEKGRHSRHQARSIPGRVARRPASRSATSGAAGPPRCLVRKHARHRRGCPRPRVARAHLSARLDKPRRESGVFEDATNLRRDLGRGSGLVVEGGVPEHLRQRRRCACHYWDPRCIASSGGYPNPSARDGKTKTRACAYHASSAFWLTLPTTCTLPVQRVRPEPRARDPARVDRR